MPDPPGTAAQTDQPRVLTDDRIRELWRSVSGPYAELTGPLIRFANLCRAEQAATDAALSERRRVELVKMGDELQKFIERTLTLEQARDALRQALRDTDAAIANMWDYDDYDTRRRMVVEIRAELNAALEADHG